MNTKCSIGAGLLLNLSALRNIIISKNREMFLKQLNTPVPESHTVTQKHKGENMMKKNLALLLVCTLLMALLAGCGAKSELSPASTEKPDKNTESAELIWADLGITYLKSDGEILMENAEESFGMPTSSGVDLEPLFTPEVIAKIREGNFTAVYCGHEDSTMWAQAVIGAFDETLEKLGMTLLTSTGSFWDLNDQISKIESCIEMNPSLMVIYIQDADAYADVLRKACDKGIYVIGLNGMPTNPEQYETYIGSIVPDFYKIGYYSMDLICQRVQEGQVGVSTIIYYGEDSNTRLQGALDAAATYDKIEVVRGGDIAMTVESATEIGETMIMANPELKGYWATWDALAIGAGNGIAALGKEVYVSGPDISDETSVVSMLTDGKFVGTMAISPTDQGVLLAMMGALGLVGEEVPDLVLSPGVLFTPETVETAWQYCYGEELSAELKALLP